MVQLEALVFCPGLPKADLSFEFVELFEDLEGMSNHHVLIVIHLFELSNKINDAIGAV